jgi:hypothetical protein
MWEVVVLVIRVEHDSQERHDLFGFHNHVHINFVVVQCLGTGIGETLIS